MWINRDKIRRLAEAYLTQRNCTLVLLFTAMVCGAIYLIPHFFHLHREGLVENLEKYQQLTTTREAEILSGQLVEFVVRGRGMVKSRIFRNALEGLASTKDELQEQGQEDFDNFVRVSGFVAGHLFDLNGNLFATTEGRLEGPEKEYRAHVKSILETRIPFFTSLRPYFGQLVSEVYFPVYPAKALSSSVDPIMVLVLTVPMGETLRAFLSTGQTLDYDSRLHLIQQHGSTFEEVELSYPNNLKLQRVGVSLTGMANIPFGERPDLHGTGMVFSSATHIPVINWWVLADTRVDALDETQSAYEGNILLITVLGLATAIFSILAAAFLYSTRSRRRRIHDLESLLSPMRRERDLLRKVNETLPLPVCMKDTATGAFVYVNKAFSDFVGKRGPDALGAGDWQVFKDDDIAALAHVEEMITMSGSLYSQDLEMNIRGKDLIIQTTGLPCSRAEENDSILMTYRDITEEARNNIHNVKMRQQIIDGLVRAVESVPFLDGHTSLMRMLAVEIAETLLLSDAECATVEAAAILSQMGKTFIPKEIMEKTGKLTPEELLETQRYVEHTCRILEGIEFDLPITQTIWQMQETLDGTGYPNGLEGSEVSTLARILGVANAFSAMVQQRSYRKAKTAHEAVEILQGMADKKFDSTVIEALDAVINAPKGQRILRASHVQI